MELRIVKFFNNLGGKWISVSAAFVSRIRVLVALWATLAVAILFLDKTNGKIIFVAIAIASILHFAISEGFFKFLFPKIFFKRLRPYQAHPQFITPRGSKHQDSSFPSSHMSTTLAVLTVVVIFYPIALIPGVLFSVFMAYARMHNGMHYPSDIIAGTILGILYGLAAVYLVR